MIALIKLFIGKYWLYILVGIVAASIFGYIGILKHQVKSRDKEIVSLTAQLTASNTLNETYLASIRQNNATIQAMKAKSDAQKKIGTIALAKANEANVGLSEKAKFLENLLNKPDSKNKGCSDALKVFREGGS